MMTRHLDAYRARAIGTLRRQLGMDDDTYHELLSNGWNVASCLDLTPEQADILINQLRVAAGRRESRKRPTTEKVYASAAMQRRLKYHAIRCAIHYVRAEDLKAWSDPDGDGEVLTGEALRRWIARRWEGIRTDDKYRHVDAPIPAPVLDRLYVHWINPTANRFLVEGKFKRYAVAPERCYYHYLSYDEIHYLIDRFREMHLVLDRRDPRMQTPIP